jgi:hypothetical protein
MSFSPRARVLAVVVAAGLAVAVAGGVGYAAGTSSRTTVKACANSKGRLALLSSRSKCRAGFKKVTLNKQGPKGAPGAKGATGPAARALVASSSSNGTRSAKVTVGPLSYYLTCDISTASSTTTANAQLDVQLAAGRSASLDTVYDTQTEGVGALTAGTYRTTFTGSTSIHASGSGHQIRDYVDAMRIVVSDGTVQVVSFDLSGDGRPTPSGDRCTLAGLITTSS